MEAKAIAYTVRIAPRKCRLTIDLIRGKSVVEADNILSNLNKDAARAIRKVLKSAVANAEHNLNLEKEDIKLAELIGLLHDIGRFEQLKRFNTFVDKKSINHGEFGGEI